MKSYRFIWILSLLGMMMVSCSEGNDIVNETVPQVPQQCDILFSVGKPAGMRMASDVVTATTTRGLRKLLVIPFQTEGATAVVGTDMPLISTAKESDFTQVETNNTHYYSANSQLMSGTNRMLAYGLAAKVSGKESEAQNGALETTLVGRMMPSNITFSLRSIRNTTDAHNDAKALADYLTAIANTETTTEKWSTTTNPQLKALYLSFINADAEDTGLMAGSAKNVTEYVKELKTQLEEIKEAVSEDDETLCTAIIGKIDDTSINACLTNNYPGSIGLPDGAAVLRWAKDDTDGQYKFMVRTQTTTLDNINGITRYTYPAELWYYANSAIYTSDEKVEKTTYESAATWSSLLTDSYKGSRYVNAETKSVAVKDPLQYGVGRLQMTLSPIAGDVLPLKDAKNEDVRGITNSATATANLPLTGVIIGGQHTVGFDFKPRGEKSDLDARFIYDPIVGTRNTTTNLWTVNTLVLQSYDNDKVPVVLEFRNDTTFPFHGRDGIVYPGTKFYLIAQLDPADATNKDAVDVAAAKDRVFTQDCTTKVTMKVESLANAYSCMPDLLEPRLEIGVQVIMDWVMSTPTTVKL